ncbi:MAG: hypothetical protein ACJA1L_003393 [Paracoccaceae bacterium]|jgi:hypothetical protein
MSILIQIAREALDMFVDDGALALRLTLWAAAVGAVAAIYGGGGMAGVALAVGSLTILIENVLVAARAKAAAARKDG